MARVAHHQRGHRIRVLHLILGLSSTNSQYNEHCLPVVAERQISICTFFSPELTPPPGIGLFSGNGTLRGWIRALRVALEANEYDVIHAHSPHVGTLLPLLLVAWRRYRRLQPLTVYTVHDSYQDYKPRNRVLSILPLALFRRVVFCGQAAYQSFPVWAKWLVGRRSSIVQNGVDLARIDRVLADDSRDGPPDSFNVVTVGRLERVKDPLTLLSSFRLGDDDTGRLVFIGDGSLRHELNTAIEATQVGGRVTLTGLVDREEVFRRCAAADLYVSTSHGEGLPVAVMEAMACRCPVILSDIPPHREVAQGADFIPLVPVGDVAGFAAAIRDFRSLPPQARAEIGEKCRALVESHLSLEAMHAGYEAVYRSLDRARPARRSQS